VVRSSKVLRHNAEIDPLRPDEKTHVDLTCNSKATELLGSSVGGYNVHPRIELLDDTEVAAVAGAAFKN